MRSRDLAIDALAATRLTRLVVEDSFPPVKALRDRIVDAHTRTVPIFQDVNVPDQVPEEEMAERLPDEDAAMLAARGPAQHVETVQIGTTEEPDALAELITCPWCAGMWICLGVVAARRWFPERWAPIADALAFSMVAGLIESKVDVD